MDQALSVTELTVTQCSHSANSFIIITIREFKGSSQTKKTLGHVSDFWLLIYTCHDRIRWLLQRLYWDSLSLCLWGGGGGGPLWGRVPLMIFIYYLIQAGGHFDIKLTLTPPILLYPYSISIIIIIIIMSILFLAAHIDYSEKIKKTLESWNQTKNKIFQFIAFFGLSLSFCLFTLFSVFFFPSIRLFSPHPMWQQLGLLDFSMYSFFF